jgi:hypothetical protein
MTEASDGPTETAKGVELLRGKALTAASRREAAQTMRRKTAEAAAAQIRKGQAEAMREARDAKWNIAKYGQMKADQMDEAKRAEKKLRALKAQIQELTEELKASKESASSSHSGEAEPIERCERCNRGIGGVFRIQKLDCTTCGEGICTRCTKQGQCERCDGKRKRAPGKERDNESDSEEEEGDEDDGGQGRPKFQKKGTLRQDILSTLQVKMLAIKDGMLAIKDGDY